MLCLLAPVLLQAQGGRNEDLPATQTGVKFSWGLEFPSRNLYQGFNYKFMEPGNRIGLLGYQNIPINITTQFSPAVGVSYFYFEKSQDYNRDCTLDSFPTFWSVADTLPGRDIKVLALTIEPAFKFYIVNWALFLRLSPIAHINLSTRMENYSHACGSSVKRSFFDWEKGPDRNRARVMVGLSMGIVKEIRLNASRWLALETGFQTMINPLLEANSPKTEGPRFDFGFTGFYVNFGFFRKWIPLDKSI